jgi:hypothetical protein
MRSARRSNSCLARKSCDPSAPTASPYAPAYGGIGNITEDTQMTLFTAKALLRARVRELDRGVTT